MTELNADNLNIDITEDGRPIFEPQYIEYLREHNFNIDKVEEAHTVPSESSDGSHIVLKIQTYDYPKDSEKLDVVAHKRQMWVCDCWSFRTNSTDVSKEFVRPEGDCKHIRKVSKVERAKEDENQSELTA